MTQAKREWAEHSDLREFYTNHRNRVEDLYASERRFLPWLARQSQSVLDVGCATGGFSRIWKHFRPDIRYTGIDVSSNLIHGARKAFPELRFEVGDCAEGLPFENRYSSVVAALGWLHWEPRYLNALEELWRLTQDFLFFDVRLRSYPEGNLCGKQQVAFAGEWDGQTTTPYLCFAWAPFAASLMELLPSSIYAYGYVGRPASTVMGIEDEVCFATFVLKRPPAGRTAYRTRLCLDLPIEWPQSLRSTVELLPKEHLETLVPFF
jgi:SAM-dependent methyltransferase